MNINVASYHCLMGRKSSYKNKPYGYQVRFCDLLVTCHGTCFREVFIVIHMVSAECHNSDHV